VAHGRRENILKGRGLEEKDAIETKEEELCP
jgi:hypothetical protein